MSTLSHEARRLLELTAQLRSEGALSQETRERIDDCVTAGPKVRKQTRMEFCDKHRASFMSESVYRRVETMVEGGWAYGGPCKGGRCKLYPGLDYICRETCEEVGMGELELDWTTEREAVSS